MNGRQRHCRSGRRRNAGGRSRNGGTAGKRHERTVLPESVSAIAFISFVPRQIVFVAGFSRDG
jgi:hypothetical protein